MLSLGFQYLCMITPPYLREGDRIGIVAPARCVMPAEIEPAISHLTSWGVEVVRGTHLYACHHQFAGTDEERAADLQAMILDDTIRAIVCARGGYGTLRILDRIDFSHLATHPKWIVGFSDVTALHGHLQQMGIESIHGPMLLGFDGSGARLDSMESLRRALFGLPLRYEVPPGPCRRCGQAQGILTGGNLSLLLALAGSPAEDDTGGKILFIEDTDEYLYHIDRMMLQLRRAGKLQPLAGLLAGSMDRMHDNRIPFGRDANEIIADAAADGAYPVATGFPAGHEALNLTMIMGREARLEVSETGTVLEFLPASASRRDNLRGRRLLHSAVIIGGMFVAIYTLLYIVFKLLGQ